MRNLLDFEEMIRSIFSTSPKRSIQFWTHLLMMACTNISYFPSLRNSKFFNVDEFDFYNLLCSSIACTTSNKKRVSNTIIRYSLFLLILIIYIREHLFVCKETIQGNKKRSPIALYDCFHTNDYKTSTKKNNGDNRFRVARILLYI